MPTPLTQSTVDSLRSEGREDSFSAGELLHDAHHATCFRIVLEGEVEVEFLGEDGLHFAIDCIEAGHTVGEMSILTGTGPILRVVAKTNGRCLTFPGEWLPRALERHGELRSHVLESLSGRVVRLRELSWELYRQTVAAKRVVRSRLPAGKLVCRSPAMKEIRIRMDAQLRNTEPLLIEGARGTGKGFVAAKIFEESFGPDAPFVNLDCRELDPTNALEVLMGSRRGGNTPNFGTEFGALDLARGGMLLLRRVESLPANCQLALLEYLREPRHELRAPRIVCTSRHDLPAAASAGRFIPELAEILVRRMIRLPTMSERKKDIPGLVLQFLQSINLRQNLGKDAAAIFYSRHYATYNAAELKNVVHLAAVTAKGETIRAAHVVGEKRSFGVNIDPLRKPGVLKWLFAGTGISLIRLGVSACFLAIIATTVFVPASRVARISNGLIWWLWAPLLVYSFLFAGRLWCAVCPLARPGLLLQRVIGWKLKLPGVIKHWTAEIAATAIVAILLMEHGFRMHANPYRTGVLLLTLAALALVVSIVFERHAWCQHLCPLGNFGAAFANISGIRVWANPWLCTHRCTTPTCVHGNDRFDGCPMTLRPNVPAAVSQCEFCLKCVKLCQEQAVNVRLDLPVAGLWKSDTLDSRMSPILFSLFVVAGIVFASDSKLLSGIQMTALTAASVVFGIVLNRLCDRLFVRERSVDPSLTARIAGALVVVAWGTLLADQLGHLAGLRQIRIVIAGNGVGIAATSALQLIVLVTTLALASIALVKAFHRVKRLGARAPRWKRAIVGQIVLIEAVAAVFIVYTTA